MYVMIYLPMSVSIALCHILLLLILELFKQYFKVFFSILCVLCKLKVHIKTDEWEQPCS